MRVLPAKRNDRVAKYFQQQIEVASFNRKLRIKLASNLAGRGLPIDRPITKPAQVFNDELSDRITPLAYFISRRLKHGSRITRAKNRACKSRVVGRSLRERRVRTNFGG